MRYALLPFLAAAAVSAQLCADNPAICPPNTACRVNGVDQPSCVGDVGPPTPCSGGAADWAQCGGIGFTGPTCCASAPEWRCFKANDYHSQCLRVIPVPIETTTAAPTTLATSTSTAPPATSTTAQVCTSHWGQCGGQTWPGPRCCQDPDEWFYTPQICIF
ncbi:hypothetical protein V490_06488 [Pseudogymnoascus sp. VKM F-3557]|nr:hypothetical protein V490_06488 [Pseudogymnoascus sp. VKM F-3557]